MSSIQYEQLFPDKEKMAQLGRRVHLALVSGGHLVPRFVGHVSNAITRCCAAVRSAVAVVINWKC